MKKLFLTIIAATLILSGCSKSNQFKVNLNLDNAENQTVYLCKTVDNKDVYIDSAVIAGKTAVLTADSDDPQITYLIKFDKNDNCGGTYSFFTENQNTTIAGDRVDMPHWTIKGCPTMDELLDFHEKCMKLYEEPILAAYAKMNEYAIAEDTVKVFEINEQLQPLMEGYHNYQADFIRSHSDNYLGHYMLDLCKLDFDIEVVKTLSEGFTNESIYSKNVKKYIEQYEKGEIGIPSCCNVISETTNSIYDITVKDIDGNTVSLSKYKGKVLLIVNVASKCGLTPQYEGLEALYRKYKDQGLEILAFPCNQFLGQEPGTNEEIQSFCSLNYNVTFPLFDKIDVNGEAESPLYTYLKEQAPFKGYPEGAEDFAAQLDQIHQKTGTGFDKGDAIRWNFGKFLVSKNGKSILRFEPMVSPADLEVDIQRMLEK